MHGGVRECNECTHSEGFCVGNRESGEILLLVGEEEVPVGTRSDDIGFVGGRAFGTCPVVSSLRIGIIHSGAPPATINACLTIRTLYHTLIGAPVATPPGANRELGLLKPTFLSSCIHSFTLGRNHRPFCVRRLLSKALPSFVHLVFISSR